MDSKKCYGSRPRTFLALVPENPHDSDADLSDEDEVEDPDYLPPQSYAEVVGDHSFESLDEEEMPSTSTSLIPAYNEHMGGIDLSDMLVHLYKTLAKSRRWYFPCSATPLTCHRQFLASLQETGLLNEKPMPLKRFCLAVAHCLKQAKKPASRVGLPSSASKPPGRPSSTSPPPQMSTQKKRLPQDPHDHNQICAMTTTDTGHVTLTTRGGAASVQRVCQDGNV
ncbi:hypothetical protein ABVT39_017573 [Epinephelus coioides]